MADGEAVDWETAERSLRDGHIGVARALRALAESSSGTLRATPGSKDSALTARAPRWLLGLLALGAIHVSLGLAGAVLAGPALPLLVVMWSVPVMVVFAAASGWLAWGGAKDVRALHLAGLFMAVASSFAYAPANALSTVLDGAWSARPWWNGALVGPFVPLCLWCFVRDFPHVLHLDRTERLTRAALSFTAAVGIALFLADLWQALSAPPLLAPRHSPRYWAVLYLLAAPALAVCILRARAAPPGERRRVTRFASSLALGLGPIIAEILAEALFPPFRRLMDTRTAQLAGSAILLPPLLSIPFATAHAVIADRLLEVRILLSRAARYLLARATLSVATFLPLLALAGFLYNHRSRPLAELLSGGQGLLLLAGAASGAVLLASREQLSRRLDRAFDRSRAGWRRLRHGMGEAIRPGPASSGLRETAESIVTGLRLELQLETAALLVAAQDTNWFIPLAGHARPLRADSALVSVAMADAAPLTTDPGDQRSVFTLLPAEDQRWILDTGTALLAPLTASDGGRSGLLALGARRSAALFSDDEHSELTGFCHTVALGLENRGLHEALRSTPVPAARELPATECESCRRVHPTELECCVCGGSLVSAPLPRVLLGKLELQERLGAGGMGVVYRAIDRELERSVAVKTLPRVSAEADRLLRREARAMAAVSHPGVAVIYGVESWQGLSFLVYEYLERGTLAARLHPAWPVGKALRLGLRLTEALDAIHRRGLLHRDVKPSNIGFDAEDHPKLLDFGLARVMEVDAETVSRVEWSATGQLDLSTRSIGAGGTPLYVAPEVLDRNERGPQQDLWSLALVLFELICGFHPFRAPGVKQTLDRVRAAVLPDLQEVAGCPAEIATFFSRALHREPRRRPSSASTLGQELHALISKLAC